MAMHQGFDLSRFKKVSSDDKATTMRHSNGHEVKIVHSALSPKMREQIEALPMHTPEPAKMARGGVVKKMAGGGDPADPQAMDPTSPEPVDDAPPGTDMTAANAAKRPAGIPPPPTNTDQADAGSDEAAAAADPSADPNTIDVIGQRPVPSAQQLDADDAAWEHDLANGHVTPQTYQGLFEKKDTLGKIGTLFGLIVGGAGSGLAHQPNMAMEMMNRTIHNDLQAQTANKHNATSYYNTAQNMLKGAADIDYVKSQTALNQLPLVAAQDLADKVAKMPPGPLQRQAAAVVQQLLGAVRAKNVERNKETERGLLERAGARDAGKPAQFSGGVNDNAVRLATIARMPGVEPSQLNSEVVAVKQNRQNWKNYLDSYKQLDEMVGAGQTGEIAGQGAGLLSSVAALLAPEAKGALASAQGPVADIARKFQQMRNAVMAQNPGVDPRTLEDVLPSIYDFSSDETRKTKLNSAARVFETKESPVTMLKRVPNAYSAPSFQSEADHYFKARKKARDERHPPGMSGRSQPLATPAEARAGNVFPDQPSEKTK